MSYGPYSIFSDSVASGASTSNGVDLKKAWSKIGIQVGTMSTSASFSFQNSVDNGTTFYNVYKPQENTLTSGIFPVSVSSGLGANGGMALIDANFSYPRVVFTGVVSGGVDIKYLCID